ncbi:Mitochondrial Rho GTPase 3 [Hirschfeldia incana]|nr:Mitochondrial Rho GTPase 3 [Hirschfeldia incana]
MMKMIGLGGSYGSPKPVRIVVVGEKGTGKTSLIMAASNKSFQPHQNIPPVLPYTTFPREWFCDAVPATIIDTSSKPEDREKVVKELKEADAIVLTFVIDRPETLDRLSEYWLPLFGQLEARGVFWYAQHAVINPIGPIYDRETRSLKPRCVAALTRVYLLSTRDHDYHLNEAGLNNIQARCGYESLTPSQIRGLISFVQERSPLGVNEDGITIEGFLFIYRYLVEQGRIRKVWNTLRKFGYNNELRLADDMIPYSSFKRMPDQSVELTDEAIGFLRRIYKNLDVHGGNNLGLQMIGYIFQTSPENPWNMAPYKDAAEKTDDGGLSLEAFLSLWSLLTLIDPARSLECLICISHPSSSAVRITRRRALDRKEQNSERRVVQCFVFGPKNAGKSALLNRFIGRPYDDDNNNGSNEERYAVNMVESNSVNGDTEKTLVLKEIQTQEDGLLPSNEALGACDVAIFVYDSSDESSWKRAIDLLVEVATASEDAGLEFPCLVVAAKTDLDSFPEAIEEAARATQDIGIEVPIPISSKLGDFNDLFQKILTAAEHPHLGIPEIESKKKRSRKLMKRSLMVVSRAVIVGLVSFRLYAARKQS